MPVKPGRVILNESPTARADEQPNEYEIAEAVPVSGVAMPRFEEDSTGADVAGDVEMAAADTSGDAAIVSPCLVVWLLLLHGTYHRSCGGKEATQITTTGG